MTGALTGETVVEHLRARGVVDRGTAVRATTLVGGVSGATFLIETRGERYVVKQPLPFLSVADEWPARQERAGVEAGAIGLLERITPGRLPRLVDYDPVRYVITMSAAPAGWAEWRTVLLTGEVSLDAGRVLGSVLGAWHATTRADPDVRRAFGDLAGFVELRGDPYHRTVARRRPDLAEPVNACLEELLTRQACLVHGDFSPKNVLVGPDGLWVLDFEVAHAGNPVFDTAFLLHHLVTKAVHVPGAADRLLACARAFVESYAEAGGLATDEPANVRHTGALLLARVHGKSPTAYLTSDEAARVAALGERAVRGEIETLADLWPR